MARTDVTLKLPISGYRTVRIESPFTAWAYSDWKILDNSVGTTVYIQGLTYTAEAIPPVDTTVEVLFVIGVGDIGSPVTKIQIPCSMRSDTAVSFYQPVTKIFLPEPFTVTAGQAVYLRVASSRPHQGYSVALYVQAADSTPISPINQKPNNYQGVQSGMSTSGGVL